MNRTLILGLGVALMTTGCSLSTMPLHPTSGEQIVDAIHTGMINSIMDSVNGSTEALPNNFMTQLMIDGTVYGQNFPEGIDAFERLDMTADVTQKVFQKPGKLYPYQADEFKGELNADVRIETEYDSPYVAYDTESTTGVFELNMNAIQDNDDFYFQIPTLFSSMPGMAIYDWGQEKKNLHNSQVATWFNLTDEDLLMLEMDKEIVTQMMYLVQNMMGKNTADMRMTVQEAFHTALENTVLFDEIGPLTTENGIATFTVGLSEDQIAANMIHYLEAFSDVFTKLGVDADDITSFVDMATMGINNAKANFPYFEGMITIDTRNIKDIMVTGTIYSANGEAIFDVVFKTLNTGMTLTIIDVVDGGITEFTRVNDRVQLMDNDQVIVDATWNSRVKKGVIYADSYNYNELNDEHTVDYKPFVSFSFTSGNIDNTTTGWIKFNAMDTTENAMTLYIDKYYQSNDSLNMALKARFMIENKFGVRTHEEPLIELNMMSDTTEVKRDTIHVPTNTHGFDMFLEKLFDIDTIKNQHQIRYNSSVLEPVEIMKPETENSVRLVPNTSKYMGPRETRQFRDGTEDTMHKMRQNEGMLMNDAMTYRMHETVYTGKDAEELGHPVVIPEMLIEDYTSLVPVQQ